MGKVVHFWGKCALLPSILDHSVSAKSVPRSMVSWEKREGPCCRNDGRKGVDGKSIPLHRGRSDGGGRNNSNHLGWFIGWLHAMAALDRNHERTAVCLPACSTPACQSICAHAFNSPKRGYCHTTTHRWFTACNPPERQR